MRQKAGALLFAGNRRRTAARFACVVVAGVLAGCGSSPATHFYALDPVQPGWPPNINMDFLLQVAAVHIPASLDRREIVRESAANTLDIEGQNRWAAPLDEMIRRVLSQDLMQRLPHDAVVLPEQPAGKDTRKVVVTVLQFGRAPSGRVVLDGSWSLLGSDGDRPHLTKPIHLEEAASGSGYDQDAAAMSKAIGRLADQIVSSLSGENRAG